jgi:hypothetical protein
VPVELYRRVHISSSYLVCFFPRSVLRPVTILMTNFLSVVFFRYHLQRFIDLGSGNSLHVSPMYMYRSRRRQQEPRSSAAGIATWSYLFTRRPFVVRSGWQVNGPEHELLYNDSLSRRTSMCECAKKIPFKSCCALKCMLPTVMRLSL